MIAALQTLSANSLTAFALSLTVEFVLLYGLVVLLFVLAVVRRTLIMSALSMLGWFSASYGVWIAAGASPTGLTQGMALFSVLMGFMMLILTVYDAFEYLRQQAEERNRRVAEEII